MSGISNLEVKLASVRAYVRHTKEGKPVSVGAYTNSVTAALDHMWMHGHEGEDPGGFGYLGERARARMTNPARLAAVEDRLHAHIQSEGGWDKAKLFKWADSKAGRHFADMTLGSPHEDLETSFQKAKAAGTLGDPAKYGQPVAARAHGKVNEGESMRRWLRAARARDLTHREFQQHHKPVPTAASLASHMADLRERLAMSRSRRG